MSHEHLEWTELDRKEAYRSRVFSVRETRSRSPNGEDKTFSVIDANNWAIIVPVLRSPDGDKFLMVRQWRHGALELSLEFPGGVIETGEDSAAAAARELAEETGWIADSIRELGTLSPNPAIMANRVHVFMAEGLRRNGDQELDEDEYVDVELVPAKEALEGMGRPPYIHALMAAALALYLRLGSGA